MKVPMIVMSFSSILNMLLDPIFIFTMGWGVRGAALATVLARTVGLVVVIAYFLSGKSWLKIKFKDFSFKLDYVKGIFSVGIPSSLSNLCMSVGIFLLTVIVAGFGTEALAAFGIGFRLDSLAILPGLGVSVAVVTLVGQNVGAGEYERAREMTLKAGILASVFMTVLGVVFFTFPEEIVRLFNSNPLVLEYGTSFLRIIPFSYLVVGLSMSISAAFLGAGHPIPSFVLSLLRAVLLNVSLAYLLSLYFGVMGVWFGIVASSLLSSLVAVLWFRRFWSKLIHCGSV
jgi:putative MATE family efflux protein